MRIFIQAITVDARDMDMQNRVSNLSYVKWMQGLAVGHSTAVGWGMERYEAAGQSWVVRQHCITYKRPAFLGEVITMATWVASLSTRQSLRRYVFRRDADKAMLAQAETNWVYIDLSSGRPVRLPEELRAAFPIVENDSEALRFLDM